MWTGSVISNTVDETEGPQACPEQGRRARVPALKRLYIFSCEPPLLCHCEGASPTQSPLVDFKQKTLHPQQGRRAFSAVPPSLRSSCERHFVAITGFPGVDYFIHQHSLSFEITGEFDLYSLWEDSVPLTLVLGFHLTLPTR